MYTVRLNRQARPVIDRLIEHGIMARPLWVPLHRLPAFKKDVYNVGSAVADDLYWHAISLPCSVSLTENEIAAVAEELIYAINEMPDGVDQNGKNQLLAPSSRQTS
jgi:dTDP-4-amino-4,6-dideoxygalactose transaminase